MTGSRKPMSFLGQVLVYGSGLALNYGIGFVLLPIYSRLMPADQYGILEILNRSIEIVSLLLLTQYGITYIRFYRDQPDEAYRRRVTATSIFVVVGVAAIVAGLLVTLQRPLAVLLFDTPEHSHYLVLIAVRYLLDMTFVVPFLYFQATEQPGKYVAISASRFAVTLLLNILFLTIMDDKVAAVLWAQVISVACFALTIGSYVFWKSARSIDWSLAGRILRFTWSFSFLGLFAFITSSGDRFVINEYCGQAAVGVYSAGYRIAQVLSVLMFSPILRAWSPRLVDQLRSAEGPAQLARLTTYALVGYVTCGVLLSVYARELVAVFVGPAYASCYVFVPIVVLGYGFQGFASFADGGIYYSRKTHLKLWHTITTVFCIALYFLLIPRFCGFGAAWASTISYLVMAVINWRIATLVYPMSFQFNRLFKLLLLGVTVYLAAYGVEQFEAGRFAELSTAAKSTTPVLYFVVIGATKLPLIALYLLGLFALRIVDRDDWSKLSQMVRETLQRPPKQPLNDAGPAPESGF